MARRPDLGYFDEGADLTDPAFLTAGDTLPPVAYRSLHFSYLEDEAIWSKNWVAIGTGFSIPETGDILPYTAGYHGIHVQRQEDGGLIGRFNMAQHGGCRMVPTQCQNGAKTSCSFTSCGYSRDRGAISHREETETPRLSHQYLGLRPERLNSVAVATMGLVIAVSLDPEAPPALPDLIAQYPAMRVHEVWVEVTANWKFTAEALMSGSVTSVSGQFATGRDRVDGTSITAQWAFPNLVVLRDPKSICLIVVQPTALGKSLMRIEVLSDDTTADPARWRDELEVVAAKAAVDQVSMARDALASGPARKWTQDQIAARVAAMPKADFDLPMSQPIRSYMR